MRHPHLSPITRICALRRRGRARRPARPRRCQRRSTKPFPIAVHTGEPQRLVPVAAARAEAAWIAGRTSDVAAEIDRAWPAAVSAPAAHGTWAS